MELMKNVRNQLKEAVKCCQTDWERYYSSFFNQGIGLSHEFNRKASPICAAELLAVIVKYHEYAKMGRKTELIPLFKAQRKLATYLRGFDQDEPNPQQYDRKALMEEVRTWLKQAVSFCAIEERSYSTFFNQGITLTHEFEREPSMVCAAELMVAIVKYHEFKENEGGVGLERLDNARIKLAAYLQNEKN